MCTVTIVPTAAGVRLVCNRDEQRSRSTALPPVTRSFGGVSAAFPTDPQSGGTWIAVTDRGLVLTLLNRRGIDARLDGEPQRLRSRGEIIPSLLESRGLADVRRQLTRLPLSGFAGFQLVAIARHLRLIGTSDGTRLRISIARIDAPAMFTSSSLGDRDAERVRQPLFESLVCRGGDVLEGQRRFHDHRWPDCPAFSVRMSRPDARTVSRSTVDITATRVSLEYQPLPVV